MNYNLAWVAPSSKDSARGIWLHLWMQESGSENLPSAFLIDKTGKIAYIGEPLSIDNMLELVINDHYDLHVLQMNYFDGINAEKGLSKFIASLKSKNMEEVISQGKQILSGFTLVKPNTFLVLGWQVSHIETEVNPELLEIGYEAAIRGVQLTRYKSPGF